jgi:hypothetical protein
VTRRAPAKENRAAAEGRPVLCSNFLVDFGDGKAGESSGGFAEVTFPEFRIGPGADGKPALAAGNTLILKRAICGSLDLYTWWDQARSGKPPRKKAMKIQLLGQDQQTVVLTWTFHQVRPVALAYSPLRAQENEVAMETIELAFEGFEVS